MASSYSSVNIYQNRHDGKRAQSYVVRPKKSKNPRVGRRLTPIRVKIGRKTYPAKAKRNPGGKVKIFVTPQVAARIPKRFHKNPKVRGGDYYVNAGTRSGDFKTKKDAVRYINFLFSGGSRGSYSITNLKTGKVVYSRSE